MALRPLRIGNSWGRAATAAMAHPLRQVLTQIGAFTARPSAFLIVGIYAMLWLLLDRESLNWHGVATLATWLTSGGWHLSAAQEQCVHSFASRTASSRVP